MRCEDPQDGILPFSQPLLGRYYSFVHIYNSFFSSIRLYFVPLVFVTQPRHPDVGSLDVRKYCKKDGISDSSHQGFEIHSHVPDVHEADGVH